MFHLFTLFKAINCPVIDVKHSVDGANPDEIEAEGESSGSNPESPQKKQRKESSGSSDLASPVTSAQHFGVPPAFTTESNTHSHPAPAEVYRFIFIHLGVNNYSCKGLYTYGYSLAVCTHYLPMMLNDVTFNYSPESTKPGYLQDNKVTLMCIILTNV